MVGDVFTIAGGKGGVGKTTTALNVGVALQEAGHDTIIVDADLGMTNLGALLGIEHEPLLHDVLAGEADPQNAITGGPAGVDVLVAESSLEAFAKAEPTNLRPLLGHLAESYEMVIVDSGAGISHETIEPMKASDGIVVVTTPRELSIRDARKIGALGDQVDTGVAGAVVTKATADTRVEDVEDQIGTDVLAVVPQDKTATEDEPLVVNHADSYAAQAYRRLATKLADVTEDRIERLASV